MARRADADLARRRIAAVAPRSVPGGPARQAREWRHVAERPDGRQTLREVEARCRRSRRPPPRRLPRWRAGAPAFRTCGGSTNSRRSRGQKRYALGEPIESTTDRIALAPRRRELARRRRLLLAADLPRQDAARRPGRRARRLRRTASDPERLALRLLMLGRKDRAKGCEIAIRSVALLRDEGVDVELRMVGPSAAGLRRRRCGTSPAISTCSTASSSSSTSPIPASRSGGATSCSRAPSTKDSVGSRSRR